MFDNQVATVCMPGKFAALCRKLTKDQRDIVEKIGLGKLLNIPSMPIQRMLVESLVEKFNAADRTFTIQGHVVYISPWDVYCILGLVDKGEKIEISRKQADRKWFSVYKQKGDTAITFKYLEERIPREADADHFARMFVLYAIGTILAPSSKGYVASNYLGCFQRLSYPTSHAENGEPGATVSLSSRSRMRMRSARNQERGCVFLRLLSPTRKTPASIFRRLPR